MVAIPTTIESAVAGAVAWLWKQYGKTGVTRTAGHAVDEVKWQWGLTKYYYSLYERVGFVRILGRMEAEPLENVFTHVNVLDRLQAEQRYDVTRLEREFAPRDFKWQERVRRIPGDQAVAQFDKLFILGKPGVGKTTFLKHTALRAIEGEIKKVPVFISLKELSDSGMDILAFIAHGFGVHQVEAQQSFVEGLLQDGKAIVLMDGLDEVNVERERRGNLIRAINDFVYRYSECTILLTCRVAAMDYSFTQFKYVEMADFDEEQVGRYIDNWFSYDDTKRRICRQEILDKAEYRPIRELAQVPLLLSLLCLIFEERNEFPRQRHEIYEEATRALLGKWDDTRNIRRDSVYGQLSVRWKERMLAHLAATTFQEGTYFLRESQVVDLIEEYLQGVPGLEELNRERVDGGNLLEVMQAQHGIFVERAQGIHSFAHLTLQEYFTARYISTHEGRGTVERLMAYVGDERWDEVFLLVAGMLGDATEFVELYLQRLESLFAGEEELLALLKWVEETRRMLPAKYGVAPTRALILSRGLPKGEARDRALLLALGSHLAGALYIARADDLTHALALARALALAFADDHHYTDDRDTVPQHTRDHDTDFSHQLARELFGPLVDPLSSAIERTQSLEFKGETNDQHRKLKADLAALEMPPLEANPKTWKKYSEGMVRVLERYRKFWDPYERLGLTSEMLAGMPVLSDDQVKLITLYLDGIRHLKQCLEVAYVGDRERLERRILAPLVSI